MEHNHPINEINSRAHAIGLPVRELCEAAKVNWSTYWRWQQPNANPRLRDMRHALDNLDRVLTERELEVLAALVSRYLDAASLLIEQKRGTLSLTDPGRRVDEDFRSMRA